MQMNIVAEQWEIKEKKSKLQLFPSLERYRKS